MNAVVRMWRSDRKQSSELEKEVVPPLIPQSELTTGDSEVYVSSDLFDCVLPLRVDLDEPAGVFLERVLALLRLPRRISVRDRIGIDMTYRLLVDGHPLQRQHALQRQGVRDRQAVLLEVEATSFEAAPPSSTKGATTRIYRASSEAIDLFSAELSRNGLNRSPITSRSFVVEGARMKSHFLRSSIHLASYLVDPRRISSYPRDA